MLKLVMSVIICTALTLLVYQHCAASPQLLENFETSDSAGRWSLNNGPEFPGAVGKFKVEKTAAYSGKSGGALFFDFAKGGGYVEASMELPENSDCSAIRLWIRNADLAPLAVRVVDSEGQCFQKFFNVRHNQWQEVVINLLGWQGSWGGAGDGVFRGNPTRFALLARGGGPVKGVVYFDDIGLVKKEEAAAVDQDKLPVCKIAGFDGTIQYDFTGDKNEQGIGGDVSIPGAPTRILVTLDGKTAGHKLKMKLGSHFQQFETTTDPLAAGEQTLEIPAGDMKSWSHHGGQNDGIVRYPLRIVNVSVVKGDGPARGEVTIKEIKAETRVDEASRIVLVPSGKVQGVKAHFTCSIFSILTQPVNGRLQCVFYDYAGRKTGERAMDISLKAGGMESVELDTPLMGKSFVECELSYITPDRTYGPVTSTAAKPLVKTGSSNLNPASPFGIGVYLYRYRYPGGDADMQKAAKMSMDAGVKWSREEFLWHIIEPEKGKFDWSFYDKVVDTACKHGITIYGLIDYWSYWTKPYSEEGIEDYANYCKALVGRYKDRIKHWEIWNEPNIFFWSGPKELYPELLKAAYKAIKETDPEAKVLGCSTAGIDHGFIKQVMDAGAPFDDLTVHPYRGELDDEAFIKELKDTAKLVDGRPIWITEMGWPTQLQTGVSERDQAKLLARTYLCSIASGTVASVSWYDFREDGNNPFYNEHRFGIVRRQDLSPKPAYLALATLANAIGSKRMKDKLDVGPGMLCYRFTDDNGEVLALWSPKESVVFTADFGTDLPEVINMMGEKVKPVKLGDRYGIILEAGSPVLLTGKKVAAPVDVKPVRLTLPSAASPGSEVSLTVSSASHLAGLQILPEVPKGWTAKPVKKTKNGDFECKIVIPKETQPGVSLLTVRLQSGTEVLEVPVRIEVVSEVLEV